MNLEKRKMIEHDKHVKYFKSRIDRYGYDTVQTLREYYDFEGRRKGEADIIAYDKEHKSVTFYEVKSRNTQGNLYKALNQFRRFQDLFSDMDVKGVYLTPTRVKRLR